MPPHGLRRSQLDKWRAVERSLSDAEWSKCSNREIAKRCAVSHPFVAEVRRHLSLETLPLTASECTPNRTYNARHGTPVGMNKSSIGKKSQATSPPPTL